MARRSVCRVRQLTPDLASTVVGTALAFGLSVVAYGLRYWRYFRLSYQSGYYTGLFVVGTYQWKGCRYVYAVSSNRCLYRFSYFVGADIQFGLVGTGANACQEGVSVIGALLAEIVFTFVFVLVVLGTTDAKKGAGNFAGLAIGLSLVLVHLACIRYTGTSVNPARSIAPAIFQGGEALSQLWIFIIGPFIGAALSAGVWKVFADKQA